ncbi:cyclase family protein [Microbacterium aerolatum]|uniref:cyclase family protein n=1 Tax=Microbacterium aerolatum TaxID=153731 RepID=UPI00384F0FB4
MNLLTPDVRMRGLRSVETGEAFVLSMPLDYPKGSPLNTSRKPPVLRPSQRTETVVNFNVDLNRIQEGRTDVLSDDLAVLYLQYSTQWDSFAHVGARFDVSGSGETEMVYYNGYRAGDDIVGTSDVEESGLRQGAEIVETSHAHALGIDRLAETPVQGPAVLVDLAHHFGAERRVVGYDEWTRVLEADGIDVQPGDMVMIHTGFAELFMENDGDVPAEALARYGALLDGADERLKQWVTDSGVIAIAADSYAIENYPAPLSETNTSLLPFHEHCLFRLGVHLGELWRLSPLAKRLRELERHRFLLTAPPLYLRGAVGSPVTPIATV